MAEWETTLREILLRMADGEVSDEDVGFVRDSIPQVSENLQEWLQQLVDEPHEQKNVRILLMLMNLYDLYKMG